MRKPFEPIVGLRGYTAHDDVVPTDEVNAAIAQDKQYHLDHQTSQDAVSLTVNEMVRKERDEARALLKEAVGLVKGSLVAYSLKAVDENMTAAKAFLAKHGLEGK
mgnify:CR=1 FL=1